MATQRYISTSFWEDKWIRSLEPPERYVYLYLLTNPLTNIAGVYQTTTDRIEFDTGYNEKTVLPMFERFEEKGKVFFFNDEWVILPSWPKHQKWQDRSKIREGIDKILIALPYDIFMALSGMGYVYPMDKLSIPYPYPSNYLDPDPDSDSEKISNRDTDTDTDRNIRVFKPNSQVWPNDQPLCQAAYKTFEKYYGAFLPDNHREVDAINQLYKLSSDEGEPDVVLKSMMKKLQELKESDDTKKGFWRTQPFLPSTLVSLWTRIREHIKTEVPDDIDWENLNED